MLLLAGCKTVQEHRAAQLRSWLESVSPEERERLLSGGVMAGDSTRAVYLALGSPQFTLQEPDGLWRWIYWGSRSAMPYGDGEPLRFQSRSETRLPGASEERVKVYLIFQDDILQSWEFHPPNQPIPAGAQSWRMGEIPVPPGPREGIR